MPFEQFVPAMQKQAVEAVLTFSPLTNTIADRMKLGVRIPGSATGITSAGDTANMMFYSANFGKSDVARAFMVALTAPLGVVGVAFALLVFHQPFGFVAMLGTIALSGMIMRNTVILVDQTEQDIAAGHSAWTAIREAAVRRFRPIVLTAAAAILAMVPLARSVLWGPMAYAIMGGLIVATLLTLLFVPALYAVWFRVRAPSAGGA